MGFLDTIKSLFTRWADNAVTKVVNKETTPTDIISNPISTWSKKPLVNLSEPIKEESMFDKFKDIASKAIDFKLNPIKTSVSLLNETKNKPINIVTSNIKHAWENIINTAKMWVNIIEWIWNKWVVKNKLFWSKDLWLFNMATNIIIWQWPIQSKIKDVLFWWINVKKDESLFSSVFVPWFLKWTDDDVSKVLNNWSSLQSNDINELKTSLNNIWISKKYTDRINKDTVMDAMNFNSASQWKLNEKTSKITHDFLLTDLSSTIDNVLWTQISNQDAIKLAGNIINNTWNISNDLTKIWKITQPEELKALQDNITSWKDNNEIETINSDGSYTQRIEWWLAYYDNKWNFIKSDKWNYNTYRWQLLKDANAATYSDTYWEELYKKLAQMYPTSTETELRGLWANIILGLKWEIEDSEEQVVWALILYDTALREWDDRSAEQMKWDVSNLIYLHNNFVRNITELTTIKVDNKLEDDSDLNDYIKEHYWMSINQFLKRDENWKIINTQSHSMMNEIVDKSVAADSKYWMFSKKNNLLQKSYHGISNAIWSNASDIEDVVQYFQWWWSLGGQVENIAAMDVLSWYQKDELWKRSYYNVMWLSDELIWLAWFDIAISAAEIWVKTQWKLLSKIWWLSDEWLKLWKITSNILKEDGKISKATQAAKILFNSVKWDDQKKISLVSNLIYKTAKWFYKDMYMEWAFNRLDPQRSDDLNTNLWIATLLLPRALDAFSTAKWLWLAKITTIDWVSNFDVIKNLKWSAAKDWDSVSQARKIINSNVSEYNKLDEAIQMKLKKMLIWSYAIKKAAQRSVLRNMFWEDMLETSLTDPELFTISIWKWIREISESKWEDLFWKEFANILQNDELLKSLNLADIVKLWEDFPWEVTLWHIVSTVANTEKSKEKLSTVLRNLAQQNKLFTPQYVWWWKLRADKVQAVFWDKFLPWRQFTKWELVKYESNAQWDNIWFLFNKWPGEKYTFFRETKDGKYILNDDWKAQLWIFTSPKIEDIKTKLDEWDIEWIWGSLKAYLWEQASDIIMKWEVLPKLQEILSSKIC